MLRATDYDGVTRFDLARTILGRGRYWTTAYLVDDVLIDTGCAHTAPELLQTLEGITVRRIINTHAHEDHIGANGPLQREREEIEIMAHPLAMPILKDPVATQPLHPYRRLFWGWPEPSIAKPIEEGFAVVTQNYRLQTIYTPGHSPDHMCLYEPDRGYIFSGDLFVGGRDRALRPEYDIWQIIASLKKISRLPVKILFPGSARVRENPEETLQKKIRYLEAFGEQVIKMHRTGWSVNAIVRKLCGRKMWVEMVTLGHFSRKNLILSFLRKPQEK